MLRRHFHRWRRQRRTCGDDHVTQTLACCSCRGIAGCGRIGADFRFRLGRSRLAPRWMARRLGRSPLLRRWPRLLWLRLRRLLCAAIGPDAMGASLAVGESLLLIQTVPSRRQKPRPRRAGAFKFDRMEPGFKFLLERGQSAARGNKFCSRDLVQRDLIKTDAKRNRHEQPNR